MPNLHLVKSPRVPMRDIPEGLSKISVVHNRERHNSENSELFIENTAFAANKIYP
jgi:hypothetical protein